MGRISIFSVCHVHAFCLSFSKGHVHLLQLLYHGCWKRCVRLTIFHVVGRKWKSFRYEHVINFKFQKLPFDWHTPAGYFLAIIVQYIQTCYTFLFAIAAFSLGIGMIFIGNAMISDMCACLNAINDNAKFDGNQMQITDQLSEFIETHSNELELSAMRFCWFYLFLRHFSNCFSFLFSSRLFYGIIDIAKFLCMSFFAWCLLVICASLLLLQMEIVEY